MKVNKILIFIITIIFVMNFTVSYGASTKIPPANASKAQIEKYVNNGNLADVPLETLQQWSKTVADDYDLAARIDYQIRIKASSYEEEEPTIEGLPQKDDDATVIKRYVDNNSISNVPIETLISWFNVLKNDKEFNTSSAAMMTYSKIKTALRNKRSDDVEEYLKNTEKIELEKSVPIDILDYWKENKTIRDDEQEKKLTEASSEGKKDIVDDYEENVNPSIIDPDNFDPTDFKSSDTEAVKFAEKIIGIVQAAGNIVCVGVLVVIGIKYMLGSVEEKAEYKETMKGYIIGAIFLFCANNIVFAIYKVLT